MDSTSPMAIDPFQMTLDDISTPAFVYDVRAIKRLLERADRISKTAQCRVLYSLKPFCFADALRLMAPHLDGFAVSSLFEARLASEVIGGRGSVHITTPGIRPDEADEIASLCDFVSFNSLTQWDMYRERMNPLASCGLRVNPQLSFLDDERYDPCRPHSKLGVPIEQLAVAFQREPYRFSGLEGIHVHSNCDSTDLREALATVERLDAGVGDLLRAVQWVNLGGGYLFEESTDLAPLSDAIEFLRSKYGLEVFIEPGAAFVRSAGYIVSTVLDVFPSSGVEVAVLDTTVNHMPEVFEYGFEPDVVGHDDAALNRYLLSGCTCLAGDIFGEYRFREPLHVGSKVVFCNAGAYTTTKWHMFNGVNLPAIYALTESGDLVPRKRFTYAEYAARWEADVAVPV